MEEKATLGTGIRVRWREQLRRWRGRFDDRRLAKDCSDFPHGAHHTQAVGMGDVMSTASLAASIQAGRGGYR